MSKPTVNQMHEAVSAAKSLQEAIGLKGGWLSYRCYWNKRKRRYETREMSADGKIWIRYNAAVAANYNGLSTRHIGGPRDGQVDW